MDSSIIAFSFLLNIFGVFAIKLLYSSDHFGIFGFEKSVAHILQSEFKQTGNGFVILIHSLHPQDQDLDLLLRELNNQNIAIISYAQSMSYYT